MLCNLIELIFSAVLAASTPSTTSVEQASAAAEPGAAPQAVPWGQETAADTTAVFTLGSPIYDTDTTATVTSIDPTAQSVTLYADKNDGLGPVQIAIHSFSGAAPASYQFTGLSFARLWRLTARQTVGGVLGGPSNEVVVIPNGQLRIAIVVRKNSGISGPVGASAGSSTAGLVSIGAERDTTGTLAPGGKLVVPAASWDSQTLTFATSLAGGTDVVRQYLGGTTTALDGLSHPWYVLEGLLISCDSPFRGPYHLYIDNIENDGIVFGGWEDVTLPATNGGVMFKLPSASGTSANLLASPNTSQVVNQLGAFETGVKALLAEWQWKDAGTLPLANCYMHYVTVNATSKGNPQIRVDRPIRLHFLLTPLSGLSAGPTVTQQPADQTIALCPADSVNVPFSVAATASSGGGGLHYRWFKGNPTAPLPYRNEAGIEVGTDSPSLTLSGVSTADNGMKIAVNIWDANGNTASATATLTIDTLAITQQPVSQSKCLNESVAFSVTTNSSSPTVTYQWLKDGLGDIAGATQSSYTIASIGATDAGVYRCRVGACGGAVTVTSDPATLDIPCRAITQWRSVRTHGDGTLSIPLNHDATGNGTNGPTVEPRYFGIQRIEIDFTGPITLQQPSSINVIGWKTVAGVLGPPIPYPPATISVTGATLVLTFNPPPAPDALPDQSCYTIALGPDTLVQRIVGDIDCSIRALVGDATMNGEVNLSDVIYARSLFGVAAAMAPHVDVNLSGGPISGPDMLLIKAGLAHPVVKALCP